MTLSILLAEDETLIAMTLAEALESAGHLVSIASNGAEALVQFRQSSVAFDILMTDLNMPFMTGEDLIQVLRQDRP